MQKFLQLQGKGEHEPFIDGLVRTCRPPLSSPSPSSEITVQRVLMQLTFTNVDPLLDFSLTEESLLRKRIMQLQEWRKMGIKTLIEGEVYEKEKARYAMPSSSSAPSLSTLPHPSRYNLRTSVARLSGQARSGKGPNDPRRSQLHLRHGEDWRARFQMDQQVLALLCSARIP